MFFVGHICIAFLITYFLSATVRFSEIKKTVSISLVMLLSILPDIDIIFRLLGIELGHRTFTHSVIISIVIGEVFVFLLRGHKRVAAAIYLLAYLSHIITGDIIIGPINIIYPLGYVLVTTTIKNESFTHIMIEFILFSLMAAIIMRRYYFYKKRKDYDDNDGVFLFCYHSKLDGLLYPVVILAIIISLIHLTYEFTFSDLLSSFVNLSADKISILILVLHFATISIIILMWRVSRKGSIQISKINTDKI